MDFDLEYWTLDEAKGLTDFYNAQVKDLPHAPAVDAETFDWGIRHPRYDDEPHANLRDEEIIVAKMNDEIVGFIHLAEEKKPLDKNVPRCGVIRFLSYMPGLREVGQKLLDLAEARFLERNLKRVRAFYKHYIYRFYVLGYGLSDRHGHVMGLMGMNNYEVQQGEIFMAWLNFKADEPVSPDADVEIQVEKTEGHGDRLNVKVQAFRDGKPFGTCETISLAHRLPVDKFQDTLFVRWLGVNDEVQHRGWGRYLLMRAHWENQNEGYRHASISTSIRNHRALLFYTNYGYQVQDTWYEYVKELKT